MTAPQFAKYACPEHIEELISDLLELLPTVQVTKVPHDEYSCDGSLFSLDPFAPGGPRHCRRTAVVLVGSVQ